MPISDELHDLVGNPVPSSDLGRRVRERAGEIKRRRMAGIATSVVAVTVLAVPGAVLVRGQSGDANGAAGGGGAQPSPTASSAAAVTGVTTAAITTVVPHPTEWGAADKARFANALALLGKGFTQSSTGLVMDVATGKELGVSATFTATDGGGHVDVQWLKATLSGDSGPKAVGVGTGVVPSAVWVGTASARAQAPSSSVADPGPGTPEKGAKVTDGVPGVMGGELTTEIGTARSGTVSGGVAQDSRGVTAMVSADGDLILNVKVTQGTAGSPAVLPGKAAATFADAVLKAG